MQPRPRRDPGNELHDTRYNSHAFLCALRVPSVTLCGRFRSARYTMTTSGQPLPLLARIAAALCAALVLVAPLRADPASARAAVRAAMDDMEKAVLAGDQAAYLSHVATDDPNFATEQKNWAK